MNYELPDVAESYVHRIGRTARAGAAGIAISLWGLSFVACGEAAGAEETAAQAHSQRPATFAGADRELKCLTVTDEWTKEGLAIAVDGRIRSARVIEVLSRLVSQRGAPLFLRSDNVLRQQAGHPERQQISLR